MLVIPRKLKPGDTVRVVAPSSSMGIISSQTRSIANERLKQLGFIVTFGAGVEEMDDMQSSSIETRIADLNAAFADPHVQGVFAVIGGFNSNQLLRYLDWDIIGKNPKVFLGFSDTTALQDAMLAKTGMVTYSGPAYATFGQKLHFDYTLDYFKKCLMEDAPYEIKPSPEWSDDLWYLEQDKRALMPNGGWWQIAEGEAEGSIVGGNLCTLNLLQGTEYFPDIARRILFIEDDEETDYHHLDRDLESLLSVPTARTIQGIVIGRFQKKSGITKEMIDRLVAIRPYLKDIPIIANADFGHTNPIFTFPIGGEVKIRASKGNVSCLITKH